MGINIPQRLIIRLIETAIDMTPKLIAAAAELLQRRKRAPEFEDPRPAILDKHCPEHVPLSLSPRIPRCIYCQQILSDDVAAQPCPGVLTK